MANKELIHLQVNDEKYEVAVPAGKLLLDVLREDLGLTGAKRGCDESSCGSCAVLIDGVPMLSCIAIACCYQDAHIQTVEGIAPPGSLDPIQQGFAEAGGSQCGFCTAGFLITSRALLGRNPNPTVEEIQEALSSNFCRCTGYMQIYDSVKFAARRGADQRATESAPVEK
jgi:aerobic carbon-monoxide dehydrogenase small subunit